VGAITPKWHPAVFVGGPSDGSEWLCSVMDLRCGYVDLPEPVWPPIITGPLEVRSVWKPVRYRLEGATVTGRHRFVREAP